YRIIVADHLPHRLADFDVLAPGLWRVDLVGVPARPLVMPGLFGIGLARAVDLRAGIRPDLVAAGADEAMDRQPRLLPGDVPERDIDRADRAHRGGPGACPEKAIEPLAVERVLAHHQRLEKANEARP